MTVTSYAGAAVVASSRYSDQAVLNMGPDDVLGDWQFTGTMPAGFGDFLLLEWQMFFQLGDNAQTTFYGNAGVDGLVLDAAGATMDFIGAAQVYSLMAGAAAPFRWSAFGKPDQPVLVKAGELLLFRGPELDGDATPANQLRFLVRAKRLRNTGMPS